MIAPNKSNIDLIILENVLDSKEDINKWMFIF